MYYSDYKVARPMLFDRSRMGSKGTFIGTKVAFSKVHYFVPCKITYSD